MANLKEVRNRISSVKSTQQITKAMKMVAAAKLRRAQDRTVQLRPYAQKLNEILQKVIATSGEGVLESGTFSELREEKNILIVVVTSDRGLCGGFNSNVFKATKALIAKEYTAQEAAGNISMMCIGKRGRDHFAKRGYNVDETYTELFSDLTFASAREAAETAMEAFSSQKADKVVLVYNEFKNVATQVLRTETFLPLAGIEAEEGAEAASDYIYEPTQEKIVEDILPKALKIKFYGALLESNASENGARMTAMDKATDNADDMLKALRLTYNRSRQAVITKEILEIVGGAEALSQG